MDPPDKLQQLVSALPTELKISIISWMVKINKPISSTPYSALLAQYDQTPDMPSPLVDVQGLNPIKHPVWLFPAGGALEAIAVDEFWKAKTFEIQSLGPCTGRLESRVGRNGLCDDISRRPFVRHLNVFVRGERFKQNCAKEKLGAFDIGVIQLLPSLYPRLESLEVKIEYEVTGWEQIQRKPM